MATKNRARPKTGAAPCSENPAPSPGDETRQWRSARGALWAAIALQVLVLVTGFALTGLSIDLFSVVLLALPVAVSAVIAFLYRHRADALRITIAAEAVAILTSLLALGELITYAAGTTGFPAVEYQLHAAGVVLGFNWLAYAKWIDGIPWLCTALGHAYDSFNLQFVAVALLLVGYARIERLQVFLLATFGALSLTCFIFVFFPAASAHHFFGPATVPLTNLYPSALDHHVSTLIKLDDTLARLRDGSLRQVAAQDLVGLITFPASIPVPRCFSRGRCGTYDGCGRRSWRSTS